MSLAWLASYPKSGNTWVRIMLLSYLEDQPLETDEPVRWRGRWSRNSAVADLNDLMSEAGLSWPSHQAVPPTLKTHFLPGVDVHRPYREATTKVLYIVRDPRDVIRSAERHLDVSPKHRAAFARHFIAHHGFEGWRRTGWGSWVENVSEWVNPERYFPDADVCVVRYEDLKSDAVGSLSRIVSFLEWDDRVDGARVERAVRSSELDRLREQERRTKKPGNDRSLFFGQGLSGQSLVDYGEDVEESYLRLLNEDSAFADVAKRWGYSN
ncbi:sulfotransferase domain-containing protein [Plantactinospora solaniradicis]|uniref:Sulfotransferase domain-containing protein n=1 Tax=Plantactinospora solaniradicis TaxID=1723736 RepID=A0ABW1K8R1_9ACTN